MLSVLCISGFQVLHGRWVEVFDGERCVSNAVVLECLGDCDIPGFAVDTDDMFNLVVLEVLDRIGSQLLIRVPDVVWCRTAV